jgi:hypothetical protein
MCPQNRKNLPYVFFVVSPSPNLGPGYAPALNAQKISYIFRTNRVCTVPVTIKGVPFEPGCVFSVPIYAMHHNEEYYPDPFKFDPDR